MIRIITSNSRSFKNTILVGFLPFGPIVWRRKESAGGRPVTEAVLQEEAMEATSGTAASETRMAAFTTSHTAVHRLVRIGKKNLRCCLYSVSEPVIYFPYLFFLIICKHMYQAFFTLPFQNSKNLLKAYNPILLLNPNQGSVPQRLNQLGKIFKLFKCLLIQAQSCKISFTLDLFMSF